MSYDDLQPQPQPAPQPGHQPQPQSRQQPANQPHPDPHPEYRPRPQRGGGPGSDPVVLLLLALVVALILGTVVYVVADHPRLTDPVMAAATVAAPSWPSCLSHVGLRGVCSRCARRFRERISACRWR